MATNRSTTTQASLQSGYAYYSRGITNKDLGKFIEAIDDFTQAIKFEESSDTYYYRGLAYASLEDLNKAIDDFNQAIHLDPNNVHAYNQRGQAYFQKNRYQEAIEDFNKVITLAPNADIAKGARAYLSQASEALKKFHDMIAAYAKAIEFKSNDAESYYQRGILYADHGWLKEARDDFKQAIFINPDDHDAFERCVYVYKALGQFDEAADASTKAQEIISRLYPTPKNKKPVAPDRLNSDNCARGVANYKNKDFAAAINDFKEVIADKSSQAAAVSDAHYHLGRIYSEKEYIKAIEHYTKAIENGSNLGMEVIAGYHYYRGFSRITANQYENAINDFNAYLNFDDNKKDASAYNLRAFAYKATGKFKEAIADYIQVINYESNSRKIANAKVNLSNAHYRRGYHYHQARQFKLAIADFTKGIEICNPENLSGCYYSRGLAYEGLQLFEEAMKDYIKAMKLKPNSNVLSEIFTTLEKLLGYISEEPNGLKKLNITGEVKTSLFEVIQTLPENVRMNILKQCLDKNRPLGAFFGTARNWGSKCDFSKGTYKSIIDYIHIYEPSFDVHRYLKEQNPEPVSLVPASQHGLFKNVPAPVAPVVEPVPVATAPVVPAAGRATLCMFVDAETAKEQLEQNLRLTRNLRSKQLNYECAHRYHCDF